MATKSTEELLEEALTEKAQLAEALADARAAADTAREELQGIVYAVSHDVKEALRSVSSYAQLLVRQQPDDPDTTEYARFITDGVRTATIFVDQLNAFSRIDPSARRTTISLAVVLQIALMRLSAAIRSSGTQISHRDLPEVSVNESQFVTVFENIIDNTMKYRGAEHPRIDITGEETDAGNVISIRDNGSGIEPQYRDLVFRPFKRLHGKNIPGIGLGLATCRKIVEAHEGKIWVESDGSSGSEFKILLPF
jgi:light-regulated signal transduction histidine kinase (bacteriophytochrome)